MLVVFRAGPKGDQTMDVVDVIPRAKEKVAKKRGLGKKAGRFFWIEVDTDNISNTAFNALAEQLLAPDIAEVAIIEHPIKGPVEVDKIRAKRVNRLDQKRLEKVDPSFKASTAVRTHDASKVYPKKKLTIRQLRTMVKNKRTGRYLYGD